MDQFVIRVLEGMGVPGAIIAVLMMTVASLVAVIRRMQARADKIYGYRLSERDTLNKALTDTAKVLNDVLRAIEERNELTEDQADLIAKQTAGFELLRVTILSQYENIKDNNHAVAQTVAAMAEAIRALSSMVVDNRNIVANQVIDIKHCIAAATGEITTAIRAASQAQITDVRNALGADLTVIRRRKSP